MRQDGPLEIFLVSTPGLEATLAGEARDLGFDDARATEGGVTLSGDWPQVWRANLALRGATRVLVRIARFRASHLAQLDKRARQIAWDTILRPGTAVKVEASCRKSRIYHSGAAAQRIETAIAAQMDAPASKEAGLRVLARIDNDLCTISLDTTGPSLHKRGHKQAVNKAPMRETLASLFLRQCGYRGTEPVLDPMCGSGTFVIEAAEIAMGLHPGRARNFAFEYLATFDPAQWAEIRTPAPPETTACRFHGSDRDLGAIRMSRDNAGRAGVSDVTCFTHCALDTLERPEGPGGLVIVNPPYGGRLGDRKGLYPLYGALGTVLRTRFAGWRVGLVTSDGALARATGLAFKRPDPSVDNNGTRVRLYRTDSL